MFSLSARLRILIASVAVAAILLSSGLTWLFITNDDESTRNRLSFYMEYKIDRYPNAPAQTPPGR